MKGRLSYYLIDRGGAIALATLALYVWVAPAHVVSGDNAELVTLGATGGAAHPSGYPAYLLWLRLWSWLPAASPAHAAAIATAILTALQVWVLHAACRAWGARPLAAAIAVAIYVAGPVAMRVQSAAEVFAPNNLVCALVLWLAALQGPLRGTWRVVALAFVAGLGISNHLTCVLVAPVGILGVVRGIREASARRYLAIGAGLAALVGGLLPYAYLLITPQTLVSWGKIDGLPELVSHFLREDYGGPGAFAPGGVEIPVVENWGALARTIGDAFVWGPAVLGVAMLGYRVIRPATESRIGWILLATSWLVAGPILAARFNVRLDDTGIYIVQRFHLLPVMLLVLPIAAGFDRIGAWAERRRGIVVRRPALVALIPLVVLAAFTSRSLPRLWPVHSPAAEQAMRNMLRTLPADAIVIGAGDFYHFGTGYLQAAQGIRPDVMIIAITQVDLPFHRDLIRERTGIVLEPRRRGESINHQLTDKALATGRPVFIDSYQSAIAVAYPTYPVGILYRVLPKGSKLPSLDELYSLNVELFQRFEFGYPHPGLHDGLATQFHGLYATTWKILADAMNRKGRAAEYDYAMRMALTLAPGD